MTTFSPVQSGNAGSSSSVSSLTVTLPSGITAGNLVVACLSVGNSGVTITPPSGFTQAGPTESLPGALQAQIFCLVTGSGQAGTTSFAFALSSAHSVAVTIREWNADTGWAASPADATSGATASSSTTIDAGTTLGTAQASELAVAALAWNSGGETESGLTGGWTSGQLGRSTTNNSVREAYSTLTSVGTPHAQETLSVAWSTAGVIATFGSAIPVTPTATRIQAASGTATAATSFTATLPNPTAAGSTLILFFGGTAASPSLPAVDPPWVQEDSQPGTWYRWRRDNQPAGETSWTIAGGVSSRWIWRVEEWAGLSTTNQPEGSANASNAAGTQVNPSGTATAGVADFAALALFHGVISAAGSAFPAGRGYPAGWTELDYLAAGSGGASGDFVMAFAESYPGVTGSVSCSLTWNTAGGGSYASVTVYGGVVCYRPAIALPPAGILTAAAA